MAVTLKCMENDEIVMIDLDAEKVAFNLSRGHPGYRVRVGERDATSVRLIQA